jgi:hypothetical protein
MGKGVTREDIIKKYYEIRHKMLSPDVLRKEILPQLEIVGLIRQEADSEDRRKMLVYPTVSTTITSAKIAESEGRTLDSYTNNNGGQDSGVTDKIEKNEKNDVYPTVLSNNIYYEDKDDDNNNRTDFSDIIQKCMLDKEGNNKGYFTEDDWVWTLQMLPNERWTENESLQTLYALEEQGKVVEFEKGRYRPPTT